MNSVINIGLFTEVLVTLFVIMDPPGTVPVFISLTAGQTRAVRKKAAWQAVLVAFGVIVVFAAFGQQILNHLGITLPALQCAGGLLLLLIALQLLTDTAEDPVQTKDVTGLHSSGGEFELQLVDDALVARSVVVATGAFQQPLSNAASPTAPSSRSVRRCSPDRARSSPRWCSSSAPTARCRTWSRSRSASSRSTW